METRTLEQLEPNPLNPRGAIVIDAALEELAASIRSVGLLQPLLITPANVVIAGHRRLQATKLAGLSEVAVIVRDVSEVEQISLMLVENIQRQDLNPAQEGMAYLHLIDRGLKVSEICEAVGTCAPVVKVRMAIAKLPPDARRAYAQRQVPMSTVTCLERFGPEEQVRWVQTAVRQRWSGPQFIAAMSRPSASVPERRPRDGFKETISTAITRLYEITDLLEEHHAPRSALLKLADGIRELEQEIKRGRKVG